MSSLNEAKKTTFGLKLAYSFGQVSDSTPFNLFFYLFFVFLYGHCRA